MNYEASSAVRFVIGLAVSISVCSFVYNAPVHAETTSQQVPSKQIAVTVVDIAGNLAYVTPGSKAGIRSGQDINIDNTTYKVSAVANENATVLLEKHSLQIGAQGIAVVPSLVTKPQPLEKPEPLTHYESSWLAAQLPASSQTPKHVAIALARPGGSTEIITTVRGSTILPFQTGADSVSRFAVRGQLRSQPLTDIPFGIDADIEVSKWFGAGLTSDLGSGSRPIASVQELRLRYGNADRPIVGIGRLRYAASSVGLLDGIRVETPSYDGFSFFGFGGLVPNTLDGVPDADIARFGVGASYTNLQHDWRPTAEVTVYGSRFSGAIDERRANFDLRMYPGPLSLATFGEVSMFSSGNEWGASKVELTSFGVESRYSRKQFSTAVSLHSQQPERSRWLASLLPQGWLCTPQVQDATTTEPCDTSSNYAILLWQRHPIAGIDLLSAEGLPPLCLEAR